LVRKINQQAQVSAFTILKRRLVLHRVLPNQPIEGALQRQIQAFDAVFVIYLRANL
jgi:hypothetical protein